MQTLSDHSIDSLSDALSRNGHNPSNAWRVLREYWRGDGSLDLSTIGIAKSAREWLGQHFIPRHSHVLHRHESVDGTIKLLIGFAGGGAVECVLMPSHRPDRAAVCLSSQIGCAMGCDFCASTKGGLERNLSIGEIVEQFMHLRAEARRQSRRIASLVFMGMGEPMHNLDSVIPAIRLLAAPGLGALGNRAITVSTVGIVPGIDRLAEADVGVHLALSLHAPDDETRSRLIPSNRKWPIADIIAAAKRFQDRCGRPVNIEYCILGDVNDSDEQAKLLAELMCGFRAHVNLIPYNAIGAGLSGAVYRRPDDARIARFAEILRDEKVVVHIRQTRGDDVAAACGQLRLING
ncbi:MAG TPA: 23S rRNA (adenine(2503)-C(2))-methyltransferase RlmN [Tepidisphaeraceae bacterium]|jgi:23S rRNA (adenine2503-C2)-methyltransferase